METPQNKKTNRRSTSVSGSLAYYNLLAGMNLARTAFERTSVMASNTQIVSTYPSAKNRDEVSKP